MRPGFGAQSATKSLQLFIEVGDSPSSLSTGAVTDANMRIIVFRESCDTGTLALKSNKFDHKQTDVIHFPDVLRIGELSKVRVWHNNSGQPISHQEYDAMTWRGANCNHSEQVKIRNLHTYWFYQIKCYLSHVS